MSKTLSTSPAHKKLCVYLESQLVERLKIASIREGQTMSAIVATAVTNYLEPRGSGGDARNFRFESKGKKS